MNTMRSMLQSFQRNANRTGVARRDSDAPLSVRLFSKRAAKFPEKRKVDTEPASMPLVKCGSCRRADLLDAGDEGHEAVRRLRHEQRAHLAALDGPKHAGGTRGSASGMALRVLEVDFGLPLWRGQ